MRVLKARVIKEPATPMYRERVPNPPNKGGVLGHPLMKRGRHPRSDSRGLHNNSTFVVAIITLFVYHSMSLRVGRGFLFVAIVKNFEIRLFCNDNYVDYSSLNQRCYVKH
ncbi:hypothetical protein NPIL_58331 [Nephila pilipes]|uniref:Transmembrane protein n=1 Tax=Nephila pilipes TaxID=299642 RepID=A0A8X6NKJ5_NEPPI|nr:hypothetical protein NPIL_58331 [Nephila pilipes]